MSNIVATILALLLLAGASSVVRADDGTNPYGVGPGVPHARTLPHTGDGPSIWSALRW
jgi:uncharacterized protein YceK